MVDEARKVPSKRARIGRRHSVSQSPQDRRKRRLALAVIGLFLLIITGVLVAGYVFIFVLPPRQLVVRVDNTEYTRGDMVKLLRVTQKRIETLGGRFDLGTDIFRELQNLIEIEIIAQSAPRYGVTVSAEEIDAGISDLLLPGVDPAAQASSLDLQREFRERYKQFLNEIQLDEGEFRDLIRRSILREKFRQFIGESVPNVTEQVHLHRIIVSVEDEVDIMLVKYKDLSSDSTDAEALQEAFKLVVREFSRDFPEIVRQGGDLGWVPRGRYTDNEDSFFDLQVGELSDPVRSTEDERQIFFFMISERELARELDLQNKEILKTRALQDWINEERGNHDVFAVFNSEIYDWIVDQLQITSSRTPVPQADSPFGL